MGSVKPELPVVAMTLSATDLFRTMFGDAEGWLDIVTITAGKARDHPFAYPAEIDKALGFAASAREKSNVYFCVNLLADKNFRRESDGKGPRVTENALNGRMLWSDLDKCPTDKLLQEPTFLWRTSEDRHQAVWVLGDVVDVAWAEQRSKDIAYFHRDDGADVSGWDRVQLLRVPGTVNHKYEERPKVVLVAQGRVGFSAQDFDAYPATEPTTGAGGGDADGDGALPVAKEPRYVPTHIAKLAFKPIVVGSGGDQGRHHDAHELLLACWECGMAEAEAAWLYLNYPPVVHKETEAPGWAARNYGIERREHGYHLRHAGFWCHEADPVCSAPGLYSQRKLAEDAEAGIDDGGLILLSDVEVKKVKWLWPSRIPFGKLTLLIGDPENAKSTIAGGYLAAQVSVGGHMPDGTKLERPMGVVLLSAEDDPEDTIVPKLIAHGADLSRIAILKLRKDKDGNVIPLSIPEDLVRVRRAMRKVNDGQDGGMVVVDPVAAYLSEKIQSHNDASVRKAMTPLAHMAQELGCVALGVMHLNKDETKSALNRIGGSGAFGAAARSVIIVGKHPDDEHGGVHVFARVKNNLAPRVSSLSYTIEANAQYDVPVIVWGGPIDIDAETLVRGKDARKDAPQRREAEEFLESWLRDSSAESPVAGADVVAAAKKAGIKEATLNRACKKLDVQKQRITDEKGRTVGWQWWLGLGSLNPEEVFKNAGSSND